MTRLPHMFQGQFTQNLTKSRHYDLIMIVLPVGIPLPGRLIIILNVNESHNIISYILGWVSMLEGHRHE